MTTDPSTLNTPARTVAVPAPAAGEALAVDMVPGSGVRLPFNPGEADASRSGNDLVFTMDNGGTVTVTNFFVAEEGHGLPALVLPDGEEISAEAAFADANFDLETAAGPGAGGGNPGGGSGEYADDAGNLIDGIARLGSLGTIYWARETEVPEEYSGTAEQPGGSFGLDGMSDLGGLIGLVGGVFEDSRPYQHNGDYNTFVPGQLVFTFTPTGTTVVEEVRLSGFPEGTVIYFGDPDDPDTPTVTVTGPDQIFSFSEDDFTNGVYFTPPKNSDNDFTLDVEVDVRAESSGATDTISGSSTITVDAVADRPDLGQYGAVGDASNHQVSHEADEYTYDKGTNTVENSAAEGTVTGGATVTVTVKATFGDYEDGSEQHYMLIESDPNLVLDPDSLLEGFTYMGTIEIDGVTYHQFAVDNGLIAENGGTVELPVQFETTGKAGSNDGHDEQYDLKVGAYAEEDATDGEIDLGNNTAHIVNEDGKDAPATIDVINRGVTVEAGWAYEGNDGSKHKAGAYNPTDKDYANMDGGEGVTRDSTGPDGAPVTIGLNGAHEGSEEFITSVELEFDEGRGQLCIDGTPVFDGMSCTDAAGNIYTVSIGSDGAITISVDGKTDSLDSLNMTFKPNPGYDDTDVNMSYTVNVKNSADATAVYEGSTEIVIDAVADRPTNMGGSVGYGQHEDGSARTGVVPGEQDVNLTFTVKFADKDGSEEHRVFIRVDGDTGSAIHGYDGKTISDERIKEVNGHGGKLTEGGDYLELVIPHPDQFVNGVFEDPETGLTVQYDAATGTYTYPDLGVTITTNGSGSYVIEGITVTMPDESTLTDGDTTNGELNAKTGDCDITFEVDAWAREKGGDPKSTDANNEHDTNNNNAFNQGNVNVTIATPGGNTENFLVNGDHGYENDQKTNNLPGSDPDHTDGHDNDCTPSGGADISITWSFADTSEIVTEIVVTVPTDRYGNPVGEIQYTHADGTVTTHTADGNGNIRIPVAAEDAKTGFDDGDLTFIPKGNANGSYDLKVTATVKDTDSGLEKEVEVTDDSQKIIVDVDAVANRSDEVTGDGGFGKDENDGSYTAFAPKPGESVTFIVKTTFDDNDGSEEHFLLLEQKPNWESDLAVGEYDLADNGDKKPYFKIPVPTAPREGGGLDPDDPHQLTNEEWAQLQADGSITVTRDGYDITITLGTDPATGKYDPSLPWAVEAEVTVTPPAHNEGTGYTIGTGSLVEERHGEQSSEDHGANNNVAMRPGQDITYDIDYAEGIDIKTGFVYENDEQYKDANGNIPEGLEQSGYIRVTAPGTDDAFRGDLEISIPEGHGTLYYMNGDTKVSLEYDENTDNLHDYTTKDGVEGKLEVAEDGTVTFHPNDSNARYDGIELGVDVAGDYNDKDIDVTVKGTVVNGNSGDENHVSKGGTVVVDAVAQAPKEVDGAVDGDNKTADTVTGAGAKVTLTTTFDDTDPSEAQYFLVEAKPGFTYTFTYTDADGNEQTATISVTDEWPTVIGPDGNTYFKIPADADTDGKAELDLEIKVAEDGHEAVIKNGDSNDATFKYGAMSEEKDAGKSGNDEKTYNNNIDFNVDNEFEIDVNFDDGGLRPVDVGVAYENNTPEAHEGKDSDEDKEFPEVSFNLPDDAAGIWLNPGDRGSFVDADGNPATGLVGPTIGPDGTDGWYYVSKERADEGDLHFKVKEDYNDEDVPLGWSVVGGNNDGASGSFKVVVDAVAQQGAVDSVTVETGTAPSGTPYTHVTGDDVVLNIAVSGLVDPDHTGGAAEYGHTNYYVLVEAKPGWECEGGELVVVDGNTYFRVPVESVNPDGTANVKVVMKNPGGDTEESFKVGVMTEDRPGDNGEQTMGNNTSVNFQEDPVEVKTSVAEPSLKLEVGEGSEENLEGIASIDVSGIGPKDEVVEMTFGADSGEGVFIYDGNALTDGTHVHGGITIEVKTVDGQTTVTFKPTPPATGLTEGDLTEISGKFGIGTADGNHSNTDIDIEWGYTVRDTQSGDTATHESDKKVIIDAVAHEPKVSDYEVDYGTGKGAVLPGEDLSVSAKVEFTANDAEDNYVLVQFTPGWEVNGVTVTGPDGTAIHFSADELAQMELFYPDGTANGGAYYKVPLEKNGTAIDPGVGEGGQYEVGVKVDVTAPTSGINGDTSGNVGIGGAAVDSYNDGETTLSNNIKSDTETGDGLKIGLADSTHIGADQTGQTPEEGAGNSITFDIRPEGGTNDEITSLTINNPAENPEETGTFYYDGVELAYDEHGNVTLPPAGAPEGWEFDSDKLEFRPSPTFGGELHVTIDASVKDAGSGDPKDGLKGEMTITVDPVATAPTGMDADSSFSQDGGVWMLTLTAEFADTDGSESHFFVFKMPEGLSLDGDYPGLEGPVTGPDGTSGWYKLPVDSSESDPSVDLHFRADADYDGTGGILYNAGATETQTGETAWANDSGNGEASPADDGSFAYRTEHVSGTESFSTETENLYVFGSDGDDTVYGGQGNDTLNGGAGDDTLYATAGDNLLIGGEGNDTMFGGNGEDTFFWHLDDFGQNGVAAHDIVNDFEYGKDLLEFNDVFDNNNMDFLNLLSNDKADYDKNTNQLSVEGDSFSLTAEFTDSGVVLNIANGGAEQRIDVNFDNDSVYVPPASDTEAAAILNALMNQGIL